VEDLLHARVADRIRQAVVAVRPEAVHALLEADLERGHLLALRNYLDELRGTGERTGGPSALDNTDRKRFADQLDRFLTKLKR
jgi:hypothetical protein